MSALATRPLGSVGAEVLGIDADRLLDDDEFPAAAMVALEENGVLVFRELHLDDETQVVFSKKLDDVGKAEPAPAPSIYKVTLDPTKTATAEYLKGTVYWHIDGAQDEVPTKATMLSAHVLSARGGETEFASTYAAYDDLSEEEKERFAALRVLHSFEASQRLVNPDPSPDELAKWRLRPGPGAPAGLAAPLRSALPGHRGHGGPHRRHGPRRGAGAAGRPGGPGHHRGPGLPARLDAGRPGHLGQHRRHAPGPAL